MPKVRIPDSHLTDWEISRFRAGFALCEKGGAYSFNEKAKKGFISTKELGTVLRCLDFHPTEAGLDEAAGEIDQDGKGVITFEDFLALMKRDREWMTLERPENATEEARALRAQLDEELVDPRYLREEEARKLRAELDEELAITKARFDESDDRSAKFAAGITQLEKDEPEEESPPQRNEEELISVEDLRECIRPVMEKFGEDLSDADVGDIIAAADVDRDGFVDYSQFTIKMMTHEPRNAVGAVAARFGYSTFIAHLKWTSKLRSVSTTANSPARAVVLHRHVVDPQAFGHASRANTAVVAQWMDGLESKR